MPIEWLGTYEKIADVVKDFGLDAYIPHIQTPKNVGHTIGEIRGSINDDDKFHRDVLHNDIFQVENSVLVIAEVSNPSIGVGIELGVAFKTGKPVVLLAEMDAKVTPLAIGAAQAGLAYIIRYASQEDALLQLRNILERKFNHLIETE